VGRSRISGASCKGKRISIPAVEPMLSSKLWVPGVLSMGVKQPWHEVDHLPSCSTKGRNGWNCTSTQLCVPGMHRDKFILSVTVTLEF
jgi:hypothetical protein